MKSKLLLLATLALSLAAAPAIAQTPAPATEKSPAAKGTPKPYPLKICIVTDNDLDSMGDETSIVHEGQVIKFCCAPCEKKFLRNPARYLAKLAPKPPAKK